MVYYKRYHVIHFIETIFRFNVDKILFYRIIPLALIIGSKGHFDIVLHSRLILQDKKQNTCRKTNKTKTN